MKLQDIKVACSNCHMRELCMPVELTDDELEQIDAAVTNRRRVLRGELLHREGEAFVSLFAIRSGFFKTYVTVEDGRQQVMGFQMAGEILGLDGIASDQLICSAVALEDSEVCVLPFDQMEQLSHHIHALQRHVHKILSREIVRDQGLMLLLGSMRAEERLAAFLLNLTQRLHARGFSPNEIVLRMTREDIGSYLGLKLETISRGFSKLAQDGVLEVKQRHIRVLNTDGLKRVASPSFCH